MYNGRSHTDGVVPWEPSHAEPSFDKTPKRNITALKDANAFLLCIVHNLGNKTVSNIQ